MAKAQNDKKLKTNGMRVLEAHRVSYQPHYYESSFHSADEVAALIGADLALVFKTLVVLPESGKGKPLLVMVPASAELDLKLLGQQPQVGEKRLRMATQREAENLTGLLVGGISALALLDKGFRIFIDSSALQLDRIYVSAGQRGANVELATADLLRITGAVAVPTSRST